jgi:methionyl aminopeptidase
VIQLKTAAEIEKMRVAGLVVADTLAAVQAVVAPGVTPKDLDSMAEREIRARGGIPSFLGYHGYPDTLCTSVNDEIVHGIPGRRPLQDGDIISIDCGAIVDGWHGDAAVTVPVGEVSPEAMRLIRVTEDAMWAGIAAMREGQFLRDVGAAVEDTVEAAGSYGIVEEYGGHGIGTEMHQDPHVVNYATRSKGPRLRTGLCLAIEPMVTLGSPRTQLLADGWTVKTVDGSWAAHFEHTTALTADGPWVLTAHDGGATRLEALGVATPATSRA